MDDVAVLTELNARFVEACRHGASETLTSLLSAAFTYLDGATGEVWDIDQFLKDVAENPSPTVRIDQLVIHVEGNTAVVSARALRLPNSSRRYLDTYERRGGAWRCTHSCGWPLETRLP
ncbi:MAG TPA: nuclear transport factor 2 family protein [Mycobacteriales bacterium]|nr:nuclear transport factor 2 family protein [Mycobacteriales bacterium]